MDDELKHKLRYIRFNGLFGNWDRWLEVARKGNFSHTRLLKYVIEEEHKLKKENSRKMRLKRAKIPEMLVMETFPFRRQPKLSRKKVLAIYDAFDYMSKHQNVIWIGPTGTGKTGLATAFLIQAIEHGYNGRFIPFPELVETLYKSVAD